MAKPFHLQIFTSVIPPRADIGWYRSDVEIHKSCISGQSNLWLFGFFCVCVSVETTDLSSLILSSQLTKLSSCLSFELCKHTIGWQAWVAVLWYHFYLSLSMMEWNGTEQNGMERNGIVQLPDPFRVNQKLQHVVEDILQMPLDHWQARNINHISWNTVPMFDQNFRSNLT